MSPPQVTPACGSLIASYHRARSSLQDQPSDTTDDDQFTHSSTCRQARQHCRCNDAATELTKTQLALAPSFDPSCQKQRNHVPRALDRFRGSSDSALYPGWRRGTPTTATVLTTQPHHPHFQQQLLVSCFRRMKLILLEVRIQGRFKRYLHMNRLGWRNKS